MPETCEECKAARPVQAPDTCLHPGGVCPWRDFGTREPLLYYRTIFALQSLDRHDIKDPKTGQVTETKWGISLEKFLGFAKIKRVKNKHLEEAWQFSAMVMRAAKEAPDLKLNEAWDRRARMKKRAAWRRTRAADDDW